MGTRRGGHGPRARRSRERKSVLHPEGRMAGPGPDRRLQPVRHSHVGHGQGIGADRQRHDHLGHDQGLLTTGAYNRLEVFGIHWAYIVLLLVVVLIIFGPGRLPELGGAVGQAMREFRKATTDLTNEVTAAAQSKPEQPTPTSTENTAKSATSETNSSKS